MTIDEPHNPDQNRDRGHQTFRRKTTTLSPQLKLPIHSTPSRMSACAFRIQATAYNPRSADIERHSAASDRNDHQQAAVHYLHAFSPPPPPACQNGSLIDHGLKPHPSDVRDFQPDRSRKQIPQSQRKGLRHGHSYGHGSETRSRMRLLSDPGPRKKFPLTPPVAPDQSTPSNLCCGRYYHHPPVTEF